MCVCVCVKKQTRKNVWIQKKKDLFSVYEQGNMNSD